ncbi:MAG: hypothetical protein FWC93_03110 [Defluviitaleaceae bacterium]|nr:hypothetical protein [Defluviitaleaceae bacterium]
MFGFSIKEIIDLCKDLFRGISKVARKYTRVSKEKKDVKAIKSDVKEAYKLIMRYYPIREISSANLKEIIARCESNEKFGFTSAKEVSNVNEMINRFSGSDTSYENKIYYQMLTLKIFNIYNYQNESLRLTDSTTKLISKK